MASRVTPTMHRAKAGNTPSTAWMGKQKMNKKKKIKDLLFVLQA